MVMHHGPMGAPNHHTMMIDPNASERNSGGHRSIDPTRQPAHRPQHSIRMQMDRVGGTETLLMRDA